ncbi:MAG: hypothetical protein R3282_09900 [Rhodothermales bacterium]|nr:hypothetical protein [Rhodothermales bacterium]
MTKNYVGRAILLCAVVSSIGCEAAERGPLEGAWEMIAATYTLADSTYDPGFRQTKILTAEHFSFGRQTDQGPLCGGGRYTFDGTTYAETIDYHFNASHVGRRLSFDVRLEGDSLWYHSGTVGENFRIEEVWRRVGR